MIKHFQQKITNQTLPETFTELWTEIIESTLEWAINKTFFPLWNDASEENKAWVSSYVFWGYDKNFTTWDNKPNTA